jgi:hypothetical protein
VFQTCSIVLIGEAMKMLRAQIHHHNYWWSNMTGSKSLVVQYQPSFSLLQQAFERSNT